MHLPPARHCQAVAVAGTSTTVVRSRTHACAHAQLRGSSPRTSRKCRHELPGPAGIVSQAHAWVPPAPPPLALPLRGHSRRPNCVAHIQCLVPFGLWGVVMQCGASPSPSAIVAVTDVLRKLPRHGVGCLVARDTWLPSSKRYWEVVEVVARRVGGAQRSSPVKRYHVACRPALLATAPGRPLVPDGRARALDVDRSDIGCETVMAARGCMPHAPPTPAPTANCAVAASGAVLLCHRTTRPSSTRSGTTTSTVSAAWHLGRHWAGGHSGRSSCKLEGWRLCLRMALPGHRASRDAQGGAQIQGTHLCRMGI